MSEKPLAGAPVIESTAPGKPLTKVELLALVTERFPTVVADAADQWDLSVIASQDVLRDLIIFLRDDRRTQMNMLLDIAGIDYLAYPGHRDARFAVVYLFKSLSFNHRIRVKVRLEEESCEIASIHDLYKIADWAII